MFVQVSGRAGRKGKKGKVLIQTADPTQVIFDKVIRNDYLEFYEYEITAAARARVPALRAHDKADREARGAGAGPEGRHPTHAGAGRPPGPRARCWGPKRPTFSASAISSCRKSSSSSAASTRC
ncbi:MAG: hypothetical protein WKG07_15620 [Hymenobacter sp.]